MVDFNKAVPISGAAKTILKFTFSLESGFLPCFVDGTHFDPKTQCSPQLQMVLLREAFFACGSGDTGHVSYVRQLQINMVGYSIQDVAPPTWWSHREDFQNNAKPVVIQREPCHAKQ